MHELDFDGWKIEFDIIDYSPGRIGKSWGLPEDCYPDEEPELTYRVLAVTAISPHGKDWFDIDGDTIDNLIWDYAEKMEDL